MTWARDWPRSGDADDAEGVVEGPPGPKNPSLQWNRVTSLVLVQFFSAADKNRGKWPFELEN